jgi:hypothetical protein
MARRTKGEGSAYMRKDGRAAASIMIDGKRITKYGKTKTEAMQKLQEHLKASSSTRQASQVLQLVESGLLQHVQKSLIGVEYVNVDIHFLLQSLGDIYLTEEQKQQLRRILVLYDRCCDLLSTSVESSGCKE